MSHPFGKIAVMHLERALIGLPQLCCSHMHPGPFSSGHICCSDSALSAKINNILDLYSQHFAAFSLPHRYFDAPDCQYVLFFSVIMYMYQGQLFKAKIAWWSHKLWIFFSQVCQWFLLIMCEVLLHCKMFSQVFWAKNKCFCKQYMWKQKTMLC